MHSIENDIWLHHKNCYKIAKKFLKCHDQAMDVASEAILKLLLALRSENPPNLNQKPEVYINQIVLNLCKNIKRRAKNTIPLDSIEYEKSYILNFELLDLHKVMKYYTEDTNKLITMKIEGFSTKECADEFNTNEKNMKVRWGRVKNKIKSEFE